MHVRESFVTRVVVPPIVAFGRQQGAVITGRLFSLRSSASSADDLKPGNIAGGDGGGGAGGGGGGGGGGKGTVGRPSSSSSSSSDAFARARQQKRLEEELVQAVRDHVPSRASSATLAERGKQQAARPSVS